MTYQKLGEDIFIPVPDGKPLENATDLKFHYYLSSRVNGKLIDLDITSKIFEGDRMFIRKSCYRVRLGEIENCVKANIIDHMEKLGVSRSNIPKALLGKYSAGYTRPYSGNMA